MTEIALRSYTQEIKDLIDHAHFDEAIAHCQHILETFPRHIETYRLLGKAFLEQGRHGDAADVFQRVLSAMPEDWLAHVAMAIVREDESNLDMAIWHMERAYEVNPSNPTVQTEVRRLRGRRDGVEPPKLRLTRSALARMYIKGGLYGQAIAEIRSALAEDPDRPDLQTLLASALFDSGAVQEAADICSAILQKLPYCMEANRVLGLALLASGKTDDSVKLFQRMESLDPHIDVETLKKEKRIAEHPAQAIVLSRLEYEGQETTARPKQPSWASSLGLKIEEQPKRQAIPDWLSAATQQPAIPSAAPSAAPANPAMAGPSWIDQAAAALQTPSAAGTDVGRPMASGPATGTGPIARTSTGELPDWIQRQAAQAAPPKEATPSRPLPNWLTAAAAPLESAPAEPAAGPGGGVPDWLTAAAAPPESSSTAGVPDWLSAPAASPLSAPASPPTGGSVPDWIKTSSLPPEKPKETITGIPDWLSTPPPPSVDALPSSSLPEWTRPETKTGPLDNEPTGNIPDWLSSSQPSSVDLGPEPEWLKQPGVPASPTTESIPEWMRGVTPAESPATSQPSSEGVPDWLREPSMPAVRPVEIVPDWMRSEAPPAAAVPPAAPPIAPAPMPEDIPEWMRPEPAETPIAFPQASEMKQAGPLQPAEPVMPAAAVSPSSEISLPDWMNVTSAAPAVPARVEPGPEIVEAVPAENLPDWLRSAVPETATPPPAPVETAEPVVEESAFPDWLNPPAVPAAVDTAASAARESVLPDWLNPPAAPAPEIPAAPAPLPVNMEEAVPAESAAEAPAEAEAEPVPEIELPDWLKAVPAPAAPAAAEPAVQPIPEANLPDWLQSGPAPAAPVQAAPEQPPEQVPAKPVVERAPALAKPGSPFSEENQVSKPGPAHVTPTKTDGIDLPEWLVTQLQGKPKEAASSPAAVRSTEPLPDWLKPAATGAVTPAIVDWDKAASQPVPPAPIDATRPAGISSSGAEKPGAASAEIPGWLDKSKPTGSDTVARWLDRRLKTSTLSSLDEAVAKSVTGKPPLTPQAASGTGSKQLPTWLDTQKPGGSDTVVRWMDKRETGSLRKPATASFSAISKAAAEKAAAPPPAPPIAPPAAVPVSGTEDTVTSRKATPPSAPISAPAQPAAVAPAAPIAAPPPVQEPASPLKPPVAEAVRPVAAPIAPAPAAAPVEDEEEGAFVPPPEWLQKALGSAVTDVPPIPRKQTGGLKPGTVTPAVQPAFERKAAVVQPAQPPVEEPAPVPDAKPGSWVPITPAPAAPAVKAEKSQKKTVKKKPRKLTDVESEALIREARIYLETDLQKASEAYLQVIDDPASAEVVAGDLTTYLEQDPASPQLWNLLGDACSRAGRLQDAYKAYAEALRRM